MTLKELENVTVENLLNHQELVRRLKTYIVAKYDQNAKMDEYHIMKEFEYLKKNGELKKLLREYNLGEPN